MPVRHDQQTALRSLAQAVFGSDNFNSRRLRAAGFLSADHVLERWLQVPLTNKGDLLSDAQAYAPWGSVMTEPMERYRRFCQTSGTSTGQPMAWVDTPESWEVLLGCWRKVLLAAELQQGTDRVFFAFSFGPFLGFWTAFEAAAADYLIIPGGGMSSEARMAAIARYGATVLCCTPTYALRLGELASVTPHSVRKIIVAGEPGGSVPAVRERIESLWNARVFDHHGMTEVGPVSLERSDRPGYLEVMNHAYVAEILDPGTGLEVGEGECGELVLTTLLRSACPLIRYRTGDWVRKRTLDGVLCLEGGVLSRCDEMVVVRGVNVYPSAVDNVVRGFPGVVEYMVLRHKVDAMDELEVQVELAETTDADVISGLERKLKDVFSLRMPVKQVTPGSLPRHEFKARRWRSE